MTTESQETGHRANPGSISTDVAGWVQEFLNQFELHVIEASRNLPPTASLSELQAISARAILKTYLDSGMELESAMELLGLAGVETRSGDGEAAWCDTLNQRRFALIDKEIQGLLTPAESVELAGLTRMMRDHVESEANLPMEGARSLHQRLMQLEPSGESD